MRESQHQGGKRALLIGIDRYPNLPEREQLDGCVNDAVLMQRILQDYYGFPESDVILLLDEAATRRSILDAMASLTRQVGRDDVVVVTFSGHGSQIRDREGDEADGWDETIVPHDSGRGPHPNRDITDDEIYRWLLRLTQATRYVTLIVDCCHSGSITRDAFGTRARWLRPDERPISALPPSPVARAELRGAGCAHGASGWLPPSERYVLIAGCRDGEESQQHQAWVGGQPTWHGALTYFLSRELVEAAPGATYRDVFERAAALVTATYPRQHPQMEGARDREVFGVRHREPMPFLPIRDRWDKVAVLGGGAAHGVTMGSRWAVYPQATKRVGAGTPTLGLVAVSDVYAVTANGAILEEVAEGAIAAGGRAVERDHVYGEMRLLVDVRAPGEYQEEAAELLDLIDASELLRRAAPAEPVAVRVYLVAPRPRAAVSDPVPQLQAVVAPTWAVVGADGRLMMPPHPVAEAHASTKLRDNLEKAARYRQALTLRNPNRRSALRGQLDLVLKRRSAEGGWEPAQSTLESGLVEFEDGDRIVAEIVNHHTAPVYVSLLDFGLSGAVGLLHPVVGASERLAPGRAIQIGLREGDEVTLRLPDGFPFAPDPEDVPRAMVGGVETFKLLATMHEADFSVLVQPGFRGAKPGSFLGAQTPLGRLLEMALTGHGTRGARPNRVPPHEEWTAVERSFFLRRRAE